MTEDNSLETTPTLQASNTANCVRSKEARTDTHADSFSDASSLSNDPSESRLSGDDLGQISSELNVDSRDVKSLDYVTCDQRNTSDAKQSLIKLSQIRSAFAGGRNLCAPTTIGEMFALKKRIKQESLNGDFCDKMTPPTAPNADIMLDAYHQLEPVSEEDATPDGDFTKVRQIFNLFVNNTVLWCMPGWSTKRSMVM